MSPQNWGQVGPNTADIAPEPATPPEDGPKSPHKWPTSPEVGRSRPPQYLPNSPKFGRNRPSTGPNRPIQPISGQMWIDAQNLSSVAPAQIDPRTFESAASRGARMRIPWECPGPAPYPNPNQLRQFTAIDATSALRSPLRRVDSHCVQRRRRHLSRPYTSNEGDGQDHGIVCTIDMESMPQQSQDDVEQMQRTTSKQPGRHVNAMSGQGLWWRHPCIGREWQCFEVARKLPNC